MVDLSNAHFILEPILYLSLKFNKYTHVDIFSTLEYKKKLLLTSTECQYMLD